jgi:small GTP-binding protein
LHSPNTLKYVVAGSSGVGKTSILTFLEERVFLEGSHPTVGIDFVTAMIDVEGQPFKLHLWDTAGQERFRSLAKSYFRPAMGVILVFDITDRRSFDDVNQWLADAHSLCEPNVPITLLGNKLDMEEARAVSRSEAASFADLHQLKYFETSALKGDGIIEAFQKSVATLLVRRHRTGDTDSIGDLPSKRGGFACRC